MCRGDERAHLRLGIERIADLDAAGELGHAGHGFVVQRLLDEHPRARLAALACRVEDRPGRARQGTREIGIGEDEVRALSAELEREPLHRLGRKSHDLATRLGRARERDLVHTRVLHEVRAGRRAVAGNDVDCTGREPDLGGELPEPDRRQRRLRVGLQHDRAARRERRCELPGGHHQRVVPGDDLRGDSDRLLQRVEEERAADRVRASRDRRDRRGVEAEVLDGLMQLRLHRGDRLADISRLELRELGAIRMDRVCERVQKARALGTRRAPPVTLDRGARSLDGAVDVSLAGHRCARERLSCRRLHEIAHLARCRLGRLTADEEPVLAVGRDGHDRESTGDYASRNGRPTFARRRARRVPRTIPSERVLAACRTARRTA